MNHFRFISRLFIALLSASIALTGCDKNNTPDEPETPAHFTISVSDVTSSSCLFSITRDDASKLFYYAVVSQSSLESLGDDFQSGAAAYLSGNVDFMKEMFGLSDEEAVASLSNKEDIVNEAYENLSADMDYSLIVAYLNNDGTPDGEFEKVDFHTADVAPSDNKFEVTVSDVEARSLTVSVKTTNDDPYTVIVEPYEKYAGMSDDEIMKTITAENSMFIPVYNGDYGPESFKIDASAKYLVAVFGVESQKATTALSRTVVESPAGGNPADWRFSAAFTESSEVKGYMVDVDITPNDNSVDYMYELVDARYTASQFKSDFEKNVADMIDGAGLDAPAYYKLFSSLGQVSETYTVLPGISYKLAAFAVDTKEGKIAGDIFFSDTYAPVAPAPSEVSMSVNWDAYYDGDAIVSVDPGYGSYAGRAVFPVSVTTTPENANFYYNVYVYEGPDAYTRDQIIHSLVSNGASYADICFVPFDRDAVVYGVAVDENGVCGPVFEKVFKMTKSGVSPVDGFFSQVSYSAGLPTSAGNDGLRKAGKVNADGTWRVSGFVPASPLRPLR